MPTTSLLRRQSIDIPLLITALLLTVFGLAMVFSAGQTDVPDKAVESLWQRQLVLFGVAALAASVVTRASVRLIEWSAWPLYLLSCGLLVVVYFFGSGAGTAQSMKGWLTIAGRRIGQAVAFQDAGCGVPGAEQGLAQGACRQVCAVFTLAEGGAADAGRQGEGPFHHPYDLGKGDVRGGLGQGIAAELAPPADHQAMTRQFQQNGFEEFSRGVRPGCQFSRGQLGAFHPRQLHEGAQGVSGLLRQHPSRRLLRAPLLIGRLPGGEQAGATGP